MKEGKLKVHECLRSVSASGNVVWSIVWEPDERQFSRGGVPNYFLPTSRSLRMRQMIGAWKG